MTYPPQHGLIRISPYPLEDRAISSASTRKDAPPSGADAASAPPGYGAGGGGGRDMGQVPLHQPAAGPPPCAGEDMGFPRPAAATPSPNGEHLVCNSPRPGRRTSRTAFRGLPPDADDPLLCFEPVPHKAPRRNSITPERQRAFIAELAATGIVTQAARHIGASLEALYKLRNKPGGEDFARAWEDAIDRGIARLEDCALERALQGEERPIVSRGEVVTTWRRYDTNLLMFLLRQRRNGRFGHGHGHADVRPGHPLYERIRREIEKEQWRDEEEILASITTTLDTILEREEAAQRMLADRAAEKALDAD